ncbi:hypothetical protein MNV49_001522 [Pseudohyphozyma bogoriensis]|nr:hypothetical protein MNV49_001522 [Pseudohyphozyma bogoriensis]
MAGYELIGSQALEGSLGGGEHEGAHLVNLKLGSDQKEGLMMGFDTSPSSKHWGRYAHGVNVLPTEEQVPGLKAVAEEYMEEVWKLQRRMSTIVAASLDLPAENNFVKDALTDAIVFTRFLHYPPTEVKDTTGIGAHTDFGFTTLLATSGEPGLELYFEDSWHPIEPEEGAFILNIGDCLSRMTNGTFKSSLHRVVNNSGKNRYSIPCFLEGNPDFVVRPMGTSENSTEVFETVEQVLRGRFDSTYQPGHK